MKLLKPKLLQNNFLPSMSALLSAVLFALCVPFSKLLSSDVSSVLMGALLYLGAGLGLLITYPFKKSKIELNLTKKELPYIIAMVLLDILAVILLMTALTKTTGANASLLGNFELAATALFAYLIFKEAVSKRLFFAIILITIASIILSFEGFSGFAFNFGSILVLLSCVCWGFENNCTRKLSIKDTRQITIIKGCFSGFGGLIIAFLTGAELPEIKWIILALLLGFVSYGISVSLYIYAQRFLGAAKTGVFYSIAPFFGVLFSLIILSEKPLLQFYIALIIMILAAVLVIKDAHNS